MNQDVKNLWIDALLSGKYKQGHNALKEESGNYCCLGVLCELAVKANVIPIPVTKEVPSVCPITGEETYELKTFYGSPLVDEYGRYIDEHNVVLPPEVSKWAGLKSHDPVTNRDGRTLSMLNDDGYTFKDLATIIEESL